MPCSLPATRVGFALRGSVGSLRCNAALIESRRHLGDQPLSRRAGMHPFPAHRLCRMARRSPLGSGGERREREESPPGTPARARSAGLGSRYAHPRAVAAWRCRIVLNDRPSRLTTPPEITWVSEQFRAWLVFHRLPAPRAARRNGMGPGPRGCRRPGSRVERGSIGGHVSVGMDAWAAEIMHDLVTSTGRP